MSAPPKMTRRNIERAHYVARQRSAISKDPERASWADEREAAWRNRKNDLPLVDDDLERTMDKPLTPREVIAAVAIAIVIGVIVGGLVLGATYLAVKVLP